MNTNEKASEILKLRVTPSEKKDFKEAAGENLSAWVKEQLARAVLMANERSAKNGLSTRRG